MPILRSPARNGLNTPPKSIVNFWSDGGGVVNLFSSQAAKYLLTGELVADTYKEVLAILGSGIISLAYLITMDATSRSIGMKVVIDGVTVFDATTEPLEASTRGFIAIGIPISTTAIVPEPTPFNSSLSIFVKSSLSETDATRLGYKYTITT